MTSTSLDKQTDSLVAVLQRWLPDIDIEPYLEAYGHDYWVFRRYLFALYGFQTFAVVGGADTVLAPGNLDAAEAIMLPVLTGLDPREDETAEWALFLCRRLTEDGRSLTGRFANPADTFRRLRLIGVPFEYLRALDCGPTPFFPLEEIIDSWNGGVPVEYATEAIYGVSAWPR